MSGEDDEETQELSELFQRAQDYLRSFRWSDGIIDSYFGIGVGKIFAVFLFEIIHSKEDVDDWVWVVVGDIPSAYITTEGIPNPACALDGYIGEMRRWVAAAERGDPIDELIPVNVPPTQEWAHALKSRLDILDRTILSDFEDDLNA